MASNHHKASKQLKQTNMLKAGTSFFWGWKQSSHFMCLGVTLVKGKVLYIVMPWELRAEPEVQGVNAPIAVSSPAWQPRKVLCFKPEMSWGAFMLMPRFWPIKTPAPGRLHEICLCHPGVGNCACWAGPPRLHYNFSQGCYRGGLCVMCCVHYLLFWNLRVGDGVYLEI